MEQEQPSIYDEIIQEISVETGIDKEKLLPFMKLFFLGVYGKIFEQKDFSLGLFGRFTFPMKFSKENVLQRNLEWKGKYEKAARKIKNADKILAKKKAVTSKYMRKLNKRKKVLYNKATKSGYYTLPLNVNKNIKELARLNNL